MRREIQGEYSAFSGLFNSGGEELAASNDDYYGPPILM
jgi:hypothetical protein